MVPLRASFRPVRPRGLRREIVRRTSPPILGGLELGAHTRKLAREEPDGAHESPSFAARNILAPTFAHERMRYSMNALSLIPPPRFILAAHALSMARPSGVRYTCTRSFLNRASRTPR